MLNFTRDHNFTHALHVMHVTNIMSVDVRMIIVDAIKTNLIEMIKVIFITLITSLFSGWPLQSAPPPSLTMSFKPDWSPSKM